MWMSFRMALIDLLSRLEILNRVAAAGSQASTAARRTRVGATAPAEDVTRSVPGQRFSAGSAPAVRDVREPPGDASRCASCQVGRYGRGEQRVIQPVAAAPTVSGR